MLKKEKVTIYDKCGTQQDVLPQDQIMATKNESSAGIACFARVNKKGDLWNPYSKDYIDESYKLARLKGDEVAKLKNCTPKCLEAYLYFLTTRKGEYLAEAQGAIV